MALQCVPLKGQTSEMVGQEWPMAEERGHIVGCQLAGLNQRENTVYNVQ